MASFRLNRRRFVALIAAPAALVGGAFGLTTRRNPYYQGPTSDHFDGHRFFIAGFTRDKTAADMLRWRFGDNPDTPWPDSAPALRDRPPQRVEGAALRVSYVGHASVLIQTHGVNLLVDPVWAERASPFAFAGPRRVNAPGVALEDLPPLDAVLVSHNHYDHLDLATLSHLARAHPRARFITPLGNDAIMREHDASIPASAHDWGARVEIGAGLAVHIEPAYHWSARGLFDRRAALWCAFVIETPSGRIYHIADTGFADGAFFRQAREKHGPFKFAILPIGAYEPRWFMRDHHIDPDEATTIFQIVGAQQAMAHHWGTFKLTDEGIDEPPRRLAAALARETIAPERFLVKRPGESVEINASS